MIAKSACIQSALSLLLDYRTERMAEAVLVAQHVYEAEIASGRSDASAAAAADDMIVAAVADIRAKRRELLGQ